MIKIKIDKETSENLDYDLNGILQEILADFDIDYTSIPYRDWYPDILEKFADNGIKIEVK
jgi:hypothetical protein